MSKATVQNLLQGLQQGTLTSKRLYDALMSMSSDLYSLVDVVGEIVIPVVVSDITKVLGTAFTKTSNVTLAEVVGLTQQVESKSRYRFRFVVFLAAGATGGIKLSFSGTCSTSFLSAQVLIFSGAPSIVVCGYQSGLGGSYATAGETSYFALIEGTITTVAPGNIQLQFSQSVSNGTASQVLSGSYSNLVKL